LLTGDAGIEHPAAQGCGDLDESGSSLAFEGAIVDLAFHPYANHRSEAAIERYEPSDEVANDGVSGRTGVDRTDRTRKLAQLGGALGCQRVQQRLLVGEVQVEGAVGHRRAARDVVDPRRVVAAFGERTDAGVEQPAARARPLCS